MQKKILILGSCGQIGTELTLALRENFGNDSVIASDIRKGSDALMDSGTFEFLDATDFEAIEKVVQKYGITEAYLMAAMLSASAETKPLQAWNLNINSLLNMLELARGGKIKKLFWPSSIAVFGPGTPKEDTPQTTVTDPNAVYGISKLAGERWCVYYHEKFGVDVRSLRYPGLISWKTPPGGGTTDYAVEIFHEALNSGTYTSYLKSDTKLPMMYMEDAIRATLQLMNAAEERLTVRSSYNLSAMSFTPELLAESIRKHIPDFTIDYKPDFRQELANSWPSSIDDSKAREDWGWMPGYDLDRTTSEMVENLKV